MQNEKKNRKKELKMLYRHLPEVKRFLKKLGCDKGKSEDIFQEALIVYLKKIEDPHFTFQLEPIHYVKQTCKFIWFQESKQTEKMNAVLQEIQVQESTFEETISKELKYKQLEVALTKLGENCKQILHLFYGLGESMDVIAQKVGLRNSKVVKALKYRCIQKAKNFIQEIRVNVQPEKF